MGSEWKSAPLGKVAEIIDSRHKTPQYTEVGIPMVRVVDVKGGKLVLDETKKVSPSDYIDYSKGRDAKVGDLIISRVGSYGNIAYVNDARERFCLGQNTALIVPTIHWRYLYYQLISPATKAQIEESVVGAVQKTISLKSIKALNIPIPPLPEQKAIAHILGSLDDKIELNRKMNATLEGMAQALFKSWFVDFDPVIDNALAAGNPIPDELADRAEVRRQALANGTANREAAKRFPAAFIETEELGWIPEGWEAKSLGDLIDIKGGTQPPSSEFKDTQLDGYIQLVQIRDYDTTNHLTYIPDSKNLRKTTPMEIMIGRYGAAVGRILWGLEGAYNVALVRVELVDPNFREFIRTYLLAERFQNQMQAISGRSAQSGFNKGDIRSFYMCVPKTELVVTYENFCNPIRRHGLQLDCEKFTLTKLRDTLLPKLISGELRISEAKEFVEKSVV